jgi:hypothetical protein
VNATDKWIWSKDLAHEPLVTTEDFEAAQELLAVGVRRKVERAKVTPDDQAHLRLSPPGPLRHL